MALARSLGNGGVTPIKAVTLSNGKGGKLPRKIGESMGHRHKKALGRDNGRVGGKRTCLAVVRFGAPAEPHINSPR